MDMTIYEQFQSLIGRLKTDESTAELEASIAFQSLIGRLKTRGRPPEKIAKRCFNPL